MVYHKVEVMIVDNYMGAETVTIECINYSTQFTEVMTIDEYEGTEVVTIGIRAVDPRMRGDGFDVGEFLLRSQIEEFLLNLQKASEENAETTLSDTVAAGCQVPIVEDHTLTDNRDNLHKMPKLDLKRNVEATLEMKGYHVSNEIYETNMEELDDIYPAAVKDQLKAGVEATEIKGHKLFDEMSDSSMKPEKRKFEVFSKMLGPEDTTWEPGGQRICRIAHDMSIVEVKGNVKEEAINKEKYQVFDQIPNSDVKIVYASGEADSKLEVHLKDESNFCVAISKTQQLLHVEASKFIPPSLLHSYQIEMELSLENESIEVKGLSPNNVLPSRLAHNINLFQPLKEDHIFKQNHHGQDFVQWAEEPPGHDIMYESRSEEYLHKVAVGALFFITTLDKVARLQWMRIVDLEEVPEAVEFSRGNVINCVIWKEKQFEKQGQNVDTFALDVLQDQMQDYKLSYLASQFRHRYTNYMESLAWSGNEKYIIACISISLFLKSICYLFITWNLRLSKHLWPLKDNQDIVCLLTGENYVFLVKFFDTEDCIGYSNYSQIGSCDVECEYGFKFEDFEHGGEDKKINKLKRNELESMLCEDWNVRFNFLDKSTGLSAFPSGSIVVSETVITHSPLHVGVEGLLIFGKSKGSGRLAKMLLIDCEQGDCSMTLSLLDFTMNLLRFRQTLVPPLHSLFSHFSVLLLIMNSGIIR